MDPILLQKQLKNNANDLQEFCNDLKNWGDEMKRKEESLKNPPVDKKALKTEKSNKPKTKSEPDRKIGSTDYAAWDKFDAEIECEKLDDDFDEDSEVSDENDEKAVDKAILEKEKGNKFVKEQKWLQAIECYTKAIDYWMYDPVFYANRALCYLKLGQYENAEKDCTYSIRLDKTYVKAYQRRATAKEHLNKFEQAEYDWQTVLELEPRNLESKIALEKLQKKVITIKMKPQRPVSKFTESRNKNKTEINEKNQSEIQSDRIIVKAIKKAPHLQSKKPLKRIVINETNILEQVEAWPKPNMSNNTIRCDDFKIVERKLNEPVLNKDSKNVSNQNRTQEMNFVEPKTSVQFYALWKTLKTTYEKFNYLKLIKPECIPRIFQESLEINVLSEFIEILAIHFIEEKLTVFNYLKNFTQVKRFSTLTIFLTPNDTKNLWKLFDFSKEFEGITKEEVDELVKKYELS